MTPSQRLLIIYNPSAGQRKERLFSQVCEKLQSSSVPFDIRKTTHKGHATELAHHFKTGPYNRICAAGGDGTIQEVINGLYPSKLPLGVIPLGTANVLAKEILTQETPDSIVDALTGNHQKRCWLGKTPHNYFALMLSVGPDAEAVAKVNLTLKKYLGKAAYGLSFLRQVVFHKPANYIVTIDGVAYSAAAAIISNGKYYGGKYLCAPDADIAEPMFNVILLQNDGRLAALGYALKMIRNRIIADPTVRMIKGTEIKISNDSHFPSPQPANVQIDGDAAGSLPTAVSLSEQPIYLLASPTRV